MKAFINLMYSKRGQIFNQLIALLLIIFLGSVLTNNVGIPPTIIVGGSTVIGFFCRRVTNLSRAITPIKTTILFLLTVASLHVHMAEEHGCLFGPAMSRLFNIPFSDERFLTVLVFVLPIIYYLTAIGLILRIPVVGFVAWFIFIGPGMVEFTHFIFPLIQRALEPGNLEAMSVTINGTFIAGMENYHYAITGKHYFPGLYAVVLPIICGSFSIWWLFKNRNKQAEMAVPSPSDALA